VKWSEAKKNLCEKGGKEYLQINKKSRKRPRNEMVHTLIIKGRGEKENLVERRKRKKKKRKLKRKRKKEKGKRNRKRKNRGKKRKRRDKEKEKKKLTWYQVLAVRLWPM
jgi:hypothetical protein